MRLSADRRAVVIGAHGALGSLVAEALRVAGWQVHAAGRRADPRPDFRQLDLDRPETVAAATNDADLVISTVPHADMTAERLVLERGGVLINCSHAPGRAAAAIADEVGDARGSVLLNAGLVPGLANLAAAELLKRHRQADCLEIAFTVVGSATAGRAGGEFAHAGLTARRRHRVIRLPMPDPFGELACIEVGENQDGGFAGVAGTRTLERYLGFADGPLGIGLRAINWLGLMRLLPRAAFAVTRGSGSDPSCEPTAIWIGARRGRERLGASIIQCAGDYRTTAAAACVFGRLVVDRPRAGCFNPEDLFSLDDLVPALDPALRVSVDDADTARERSPSSSRSSSTS